MLSGKPTYVDKTFAPDFETAKRIFEIAEKVGIPNPDYFGKCFRKKMGVSIKEYRKGKKSAEKSKEN